MVPARCCELGGLEFVTDWPRDLRTLSVYVEGGPICLDCVGGRIAFASEKGLFSPGAALDKGAGLAESWGMALESRKGFVEPKLKPSPPRKWSADPALDDRRFLPANVFRFIFACSASCLSSMLRRVRKSGCELRPRCVSFIPRVFANRSSPPSCLPRLRPNRHPDPDSRSDLEKNPRKPPLRGGDPSRPDLPLSLTLIEPSRNCEFPLSRFTLGEGLRTTRRLTRPRRFLKFCPNVARNFSDRGVGPMESRLKMYGFFSKLPNPFSGPPKGVRRVLLRFRLSLLRTNQKTKTIMATNATPPTTPPTTA